MLIDEEIGAGGEHVRTSLVALDDGLMLQDSAGLEVAVRAAWIRSIMHRYGRELDPEIEAGTPELDLGDGRALGRLDFRAQVDADSRTYLVLHEPGQPPIAALSNGVAAALRHLARSA